MLYWAFILFVVSVVAAMRGFEELAGMAGNLSLMLGVLFVGLFAFALVMSALTRSRRRDS